MTQSIMMNDAGLKAGSRFSYSILDKKAVSAARNGVRRQTRSGVLKPSVKALIPSAPVAPVALVKPAQPVRTEQELALAQRQARQAEESKVLALEVRQAQSGDSSAVARLIEGNRTWVRGIAYSVLGDAHLAEDAAQEVCVRMCKHLNSLEAPEAFRPWVYRMTRNVALSMAQRRERMPQPVALDTESMREGARVSVEEMPGASLDEDESVGTILETINRLPDIYREVLVLKHVQELSYAEMATILNVSVKSLEVRLVRARKMLQDRLGRNFLRGRKRDPRGDRKA